MARLEADLSFFTFASDYDPTHYNNWTEKELAALGNCKATAGVVKMRLEDNGLIVKEMYAIEHKSEKKANSQSEVQHNSTDETRVHYHIIVKFEPTHGATLKEIAKYISVPPEVIEKPKPGRYSYDNVLSYLTHIKYMDKLQYDPKKVVTLAGTDYMDYFNERKERWIKARAMVRKNRPLNSILREAIAKMEKGEISFDELSGVKEYRKLLFEPKYAKQLERKAHCVKEVAEQDYNALCKKINNKEISSLDEVTASEEWKLAYKYRNISIESELRTHANSRRHP